MILQVDMVAQSVYLQMPIPLKYYVLEYDDTYDQIFLCMLKEYRVKLSVFFFSMINPTCVEIWELEEYPETKD